MRGPAPDEPLAADAIRAAADATRQALAGSDALRALAHDLSTLGTLDATVERGLQAALTVAQAAGAMIAGRPGEQLSGLVVLGALGREAKFYRVGDVLRERDPQVSVARSGEARATGDLEGESEALLTLAPMARCSLRPAWMEPRSCGKLPR